ncbi:DUF1120 domain-containing protein [Burkholderia cepacia]|uniref:DUF1120 domain-containing protein n=1 Tax=Burkholderia cepacia TaxID=292 RepID=UPI002ABD1BCA|nr:DUF1120 domain-containing protein [Burkholderia cepacia]
MINHIRVCLVAVTSIGSCAFAQVTNQQTIDTTSFNIAVRGSIKPGSCTPSLENNSRFDYQHIDSADNLQAVAPTMLPPLRTQLVVTCQSPTELALTSSDMRKGTAAFSSDVFFFSSANQNQKKWTASRQYGLGTTTEGKKIGSWALKLEPGTFTADGKQVNSVYSKDQGVSWGNSAGNFFPGYDDWESWSLNSPSDNVLTPVAAKVFEGTILVQAMIASRNDLNMTGALSLDGSAVITLIYL